MSCCILITRVDDASFTSCRRRSGTTCRIEFQSFPATPRQVRSVAQNFTSWQRTLRNLKTPKTPSHRQQKGRSSGAATFSFQQDSFDLCFVLDADLNATDILLFRLPCGSAKALKTCVTTSRVVFLVIVFQQRLILSQLKILSVKFLTKEVPWYTCTIPAASLLERAVPDRMTSLPSWSNL